MFVTNDFSHNTKQDVTALEQACALHSKECISIHACRSMMSLPAGPAKLTGIQKEATGEQQVYGDVMDVQV